MKLKDQKESNLSPSYKDPNLALKSGFLSFVLFKLIIARAKGKLTFYRTKNSTVKTIEALSREVSL